MLKIQKQIDGQWVDFVTIHDRGLSDTYRVATDKHLGPEKRLAAREANPIEVIDLLREVSSAYAEFRRCNANVRDDRVGTVMEDIEFVRLENLDADEKKYLIALAMLGFNSAMLISEIAD